MTLSIKSGYTDIKGPIDSALTIVWYIPHAQTLKLHYFLSGVVFS